MLSLKVLDIEDFFSSDRRQSAFGLPRLLPFSSFPFAFTRESLLLTEDAEDELKESFLIVNVTWLIVLCGGLLPQISPEEEEDSDIWEVVLVKTVADGQVSALPHMLERESPLFTISIGKFFLYLLSLSETGEEAADETLSLSVSPPDCKKALLAAF